jgi:hypothetical protein
LEELHNNQDAIDTRHLRHPKNNHLQSKQSLTADMPVLQLQGQQAELLHKNVEHCQHLPNTQTKELSERFLQIFFS